MLRSPFVSTEGVAKKKGGRAFWPVTFDSQPPVVSDWSVPLPPTTAYKPYSIISLLYLSKNLY